MRPQTTHTGDGQPSPVLLWVPSERLDKNSRSWSKPQVIELLGAGTVVKLAPLNLTSPAQKVGTKSPPQNVTLTNEGSTTAEKSTLRKLRVL